MSRALLALLVLLSGNVHHLPSPGAVARLLAMDDVSPREASFMAARAVGRPDLGPELARIATREGKWVQGKPSQVHRGDSWASRTVYDRAVRKGWVDEHCQPYEPGAWSTRGAHGLMAAYNLHRVPELGLCPEPSELDRPAVSALAAARKAVSVGGTCEDRHRAWVGAQRWDSWPVWKRWHRAWRHCDGPPPSMVRAWMVLVSVFALGT